MECTISYLGVGVAVLFTALFSSALGVMYGLAKRQGSERRYARLAAELVKEKPTGA